MSAFSYMIFFTGVNNPRHGCTVIGWQDAVPLFFEFETDSSCTTVGTIVECTTSVLLTRLCYRFREIDNLLLLCTGELVLDSARPISAVWKSP